MQVSTLSFTVVHGALELEYTKRFLAFCSQTFVLFFGYILLILILIFLLFEKKFSISKNNIIRAEAVKVLQ
jgi:hypothetical protein